MPVRCGMCERDLHREIALSRPDVDESLVLAQGNCRAIARLAPWLIPVIAGGIL